MFNTVNIGSQQPLPASLASQWRCRAASASTRQLQQLHLTARSTKSAASAELDSVLATLDPQKVEVLQHVDRESYRQLADCEANAQLQAADMATLLLRVTAFHRLWCQYHAEADPELCDIGRMISKIVIMTKLLAGGSSQHVLQTAERYPPVMAQSSSCIVERMVRIKQLIPQSDVSQVVSRRPSLLCMETEVLAGKVKKAAQQLRALMPAIPWESRLTNDSNLWMTFWTLLDDSNFGVPNY